MGEATFLNERRQRFSPHQRGELWPQGRPMASRRRDSRTPPIDAPARTSSLARRLVSNPLLSASGKATRCSGGLQPALAKPCGYRHSFRTPSGGKGRCRRDSPPRRPTPSVLEATHASATVQQPILVPVLRLPFRARHDSSRLLFSYSAGSSTPTASLSADTPSASVSRKRAASCGKPWSSSQPRSELAGTLARRAASARDRPAAVRGATANRR
jgi:hypothetical protein